MRDSETTGRKKRKKKEKKKGINKKNQWGGKERPGLPRTKKREKK